MNDKIKEIKSVLKLNDRELSEFLKMNRGTLYKRLKDGNWHPHEIFYINYKHKELYEINAL